MNLESTIEGVLFYRAEPIEKAELSRLLSVSTEQIDAALGVLTHSLLGRGVTLIETDTEVQLATAPELSEIIETMRRDELKRDIGKAGAETLSIILYKGPVTRSDIDFIRGVNSTFVLRNLLVRGLVEKVSNPNDQRSFRYTITPALLAHLGVSRKEDLPHYSDVIREIDRYEAEQRSQGEEVNVATS